MTETISPPRPNLFVIGAAKSGTTSLHHYLDAHPDIFMSHPKEPAIFVPEYDQYPREMDWYMDLFKEADDAQLVGESSTHYTMLPTYTGVPKRIKRFAPDARFIYVMRDPVDRAISHYWHRFRQSKEHRPIGIAMRSNVEYVSFSDYHRQLTPYFREFGRDAVLPLTFERMIDYPKKTMRTVYSWLGLEAALNSEVLAEKWNERPERQKYVKGRGLLHRLRYAGLWSQISPLIPQSLKDIGKKLAIKEVEPGGAPPGVKNYLRSELRPSVDRLQQLLDERFTEWTTIMGGEGGS